MSAATSPTSKPAPNEASQAPGPALYLLPVGLGGGDAASLLPAQTLQTIRRLRHFVVENAKTARASLRWCGHPSSLRELDIAVITTATANADIDRLLQPLGAGLDLGVMSEAGCPGVADPGALLVRRAHQRGFSVRPLIGPSSLLLALMASGLDGQRFAFHGYLPRRDPQRSQRIVALEAQSRRDQQTQLFIETPYRNAALFDALLASCRADTLLCVASDLTLADERVCSRTIGAWRAAAPPDLQRRPCVFLLLSAG